MFVNFERKHARGEGIGSRAPRHEYEIVSSLYHLEKDDPSSGWFTAEIVCTNEISGSDGRGLWRGGEPAPCGHCG